jgi:tyrosine-protein kinase Etk/Wzc
LNSEQLSSGISPQSQFTEGRSELGNLSLRDMFFKYIRFLPLFVISVAMGLFAAYVYLRYAPRVYRASGAILLKKDQDKMANDKLGNLLMSNRDFNLQNEIEVLKSRPLMEKVVKQLGLQVSYYGIGRIRKDNIYTTAPFRLRVYELKDSSASFSMNVVFNGNGQFRINNDNSFKFGEIFQNQFGVFSLEKIPGASISREYSIEWVSASSMAGMLTGGLQIAPKSPGTGILTISMSGAHPHLCADIINELMIQYEQKTIQDKNAAAAQTLDFIDIRLDTLGRELEFAQKQLLDYQIKNDLIDVESQSGTYFSAVSESDKASNELQYNLNTAEVVESYLADKKNEFNVVPSALGLSDATLNALIAEYNRVQMQRKLLVDANIPAENPAVREKTSEIEEIRQRILQSLKNIKTFYQFNLNEFRKKNISAQSQVRSLPFKLKEYEELKKQVENKQKLYNFLQERREETAISRASTTADSQVVEMAYASTLPIKPNKKTIRMLAILLGLALPAMFIFVSEILNDKITNRYDIERITSAPILGEIGHSYSSKALIVNKTNRSMVAEQFRIIRSNLQYVAPNIEKPVILVTSSYSGEGKSFVTTNLGAVMALAGKKTIVLEFDIRKPKVLKGLGMSNRKGITNYLVGNATPEEIVIPVEGYENLYIMPCGPVPPNPAELLLDAKVPQLINWLRQQFDVVLLDSAPVGMVSDALTLSKFCDCTLYLVRQGHTFKKQIGLIDEFYVEKKLPKVSIIINDIKIKPGFGYYGYGRYGYGYGYGYGSYYEEEVPPESFIEKQLGNLNPRRWIRWLRGK